MGKDRFIERIIGNERHVLGYRINDDRSVKFVKEVYSEGRVSSEKISIESEYVSDVLRVLKDAKTLTKN